MSGRPIGRPVYHPNDKDRALVEETSSFGLPQSAIAAQLNIDEKTLRKHFRTELDGGKFRLDLLCGRTIKAALEAGNLDAAKFYAARRMGWKETTRREQSGPDGGPIKNENTLNFSGTPEQLEECRRILRDTI